MAGKARGLPGAYVALFKKIEELGGVNPRFPSLAGYTISPREVNPIQTYLVDNLGFPSRWCARSAASSAPTPVPVRLVWPSLITGWSSTDRI